VKEKKYQHVGLPKENYVELQRNTHIMPILYFAFATSLIAM